MTTVTGLVPSAASTVNTAVVGNYYGDLHRE